jgi:N-acetylglucosamine repressor
VRKINVLDFKLATRTTAREVNRQILLNLVREHQPISRADLARKMRVGRGVVTSLSAELLAEGAIREGETGEAARGRKPTFLYVRTHDRFAIAIDIRFSRTYLMLSDFDGTQLVLESFETMFSPEELVSELTDRVQRMIRTHRSEGTVEGIGIVVPGMVERQTGRVLNSPQLGWRDIDIRGPLEAAVGLKVHVENAPTACALAQMWLGQRGEGSAADFVYVSVSDGVGAGVVVNGQVVRGKNDAAGEFGHVALAPDGPECLCGGRGCWETYTSNLATIARYLGCELSLSQSRELLKYRAISYDDLLTRARTGDRNALAALEVTGRYLGQGLSMIVKALNPSQIFVGGEITAAWDLIDEVVRAEVESRSLTENAAHTPIIPEQASAYPRLRGATALVAAPLFAAPRLA